MNKIIFSILMMLSGFEAESQIFSFNLFDDVKVTVDNPVNYKSRNKTRIIFFALPNGNTTEQTMGKVMKKDDDWHFDIQHIKGQTAFIRQELPKQNIVVVYLENNYKSWPAWKAKHTDHIKKVRQIIDTIVGKFRAKKTTISLNGHSGGGRFIFSFLDGLSEIPLGVDNISFLDSDYGYESRYAPLLVSWLQRNKRARLNVFAYNDSVALYQGKRIVSDTGGTWYRSHLMLRDLSLLNFTRVRNDSLLVYHSSAGNVRFYFKTNPDRLIFHTQQVELNGFIHSILAGTKMEEKNYRYYGPRAYSSLIQ